MYEKLISVRKKTLPKQSEKGYGNLVQNVVRDLLYIVHNALKFNPPDEIVHKQARALGVCLRDRYLPTLRRNLLVLEDNFVCLNCGGGDSQDINQLIMCDFCCQWFHQLCCNVEDVPPGL